MPLAILGQRNEEKPENARKKKAKIMLRLCSILKIMPLWFQKMLCLISSKSRTNSCIMSAYHQLNTTKTAKLLN